MAQMGFGMCRRTSYHDQDSWVRFRNGGYDNASQAIMNHQYGFAHVCPCLPTNSHLNRKIWENDDNPLELG